MSPEALGPLGAAGDQGRDRFSVSYLVGAAARIIRDLATLSIRASKANKRLATLTLETEVRFRGAEDGRAFAEELAGQLARLAAEYSDPGGHPFRFVAAGFRQPRRRRKTMDENPRASTRKHEIEVELQATPEEVWRAVTEAEGIQEWFAPDVRVTPGEGGSIYVGWGPGMGGEAPIRVWEPGKRFGWVENEGTDRVKVVTFEIRAGEPGASTTTLRLVHSGFGADAQFDDEYEATFGGWSTFFAMLRDRLARFAGVRGVNVTVFGMSAEVTKKEAWARMQEALAITSTEEGGEFTAHVGPLPIAGTVLRHAREGCLCLSLPDSVLGVFVEGGKQAMVTLQWVLYGKSEAGVREAIELLVAECLGGIEARGAAGGQQAEAEPHGD